MDIGAVSWAVGGGIAMAGSRPSTGEVPIISILSAQGRVELRRISYDFVESTKDLRES
ncbi:hypothetical protein [Luteimonas marina]|uniref:hypothetical protein n=1 Tax=Luteimonas marina TaxID=488485 RepID=UPI0013155374|nr:hypothetical protein [Luteimonas marina]